ncbi:Zn-ribbon-containing protein [Seminibacterium arietis]|uniref:Zn-ribbon-containing protein n=1 Tax=Seminibacterium arietis TaxID=1173502 RepID=A0ABW3I8D2_9PAST
MYLVEAFFKHQNDNLQQMADYTFLVNNIIDQWRYNGQIIGREIPLFFAQLDQQLRLAVKVICPEQQSLSFDFNNSEVSTAFENAESAGIFFDGFQLLAEDLNSDITHNGNTPNWQILYTTYLQSCSPLHSGDDFLPIPLYKQLQNIPHLSMDIIKWQENWQACDQLQMNGSVLEQQALAEISNTNSNLFKHGYYLAQEIERSTAIPTYYYLYHVGGNNFEQEKYRTCPLCHQKWLLDKPLFDIFYFKCDHCRIVSNMAWRWQS